MTQKRLLLFFIIALLPGAFISCHDDDDDLIGLWERRGEFANSPRFGAASFTLGDKGYLVGGYSNQESLKDVWVYDIKLNRWDIIRDQDPKNEKNISFPGHARQNGVAAGCELNGKGYFGLGMLSDYDGEYLNNYGETDLIPLRNTNGRLWDWWEFNPTGNGGLGEWTRLPDFPGYASTEGIAFCIGNKIYVGTGEAKDVGRLSDIFAYNVETGQWEPEHIGYTEKVIGASVFVINDIAYIVGGSRNSEQNKYFKSYNPKDNRWTELRTIVNDTDDDYDDDYTTILRTYGSTFVIDGYGYLTCGSNGGVNRTTWKYDPRTDLWEEMRKFKGSGREQAVSFSNGTIQGAIITTGYSGTNYFDDTWNFDPYTWDDDDF